IPPSRSLASPMLETVTSIRSPAREKGGSSAFTMTTAAFLLRMSWGATETPKLATREEREERRRDEVEESPLPLRPVTSPSPRIWFPLTPRRVAMSLIRTVGAAVAAAADSARNRKARALRELNFHGLRVDNPADKASLAVRNIHPYSSAHGSRGGSLPRYLDCDGTLAKDHSYRRAGPHSV